MRTALLIVLATLCASCVMGPRTIPILATGKMTADFETYSLQRVGLVPFTGERMSAERAGGLQSAFFTEVSQAGGFEVVMLRPNDLDEIPASDPYRRGIYEGRTVISLARRYHLDGVLVCTVTDEQLHPPQRLSLQVDLVAAETGLPIWSASVHLDARNEDVRHGLKALHRRSYGDQGDGWEVALLSPSRFAQFAALQIAELYHKSTKAPAGSP